MPLASADAAGLCSAEASKGIAGMESMGAWRQEDRDALEWALGVLGDSQRECADALHELGAPGATQTSVSKWISGVIKKPRPKTIAAVRAYVDLARTASPGSGTNAGAADNDEAFEETVRGITSEPLLGPRQADLVDALIARLRSGSAMTPADEAASSALQRFLGLEAQE